ncbi:unnamed protein product [Protopolystoma xenopodis]|uniref:Uncharacterized protein n=1 Tax=Protopolystoma xenopodis TaxID=117903 RepID=A0A448WCX4_9PLAT|nr:unnamed protein product [Protopolystoma xenopodis]
MAAIMVSNKRRELRSYRDLLVQQAAQLRNCLVPGQIPDIEVSYSTGHLLFLFINLTLYLEFQSLPNWILYRVKDFTILKDPYCCSRLA